MPRLAFRNDRTRVWTKNGRGRAVRPKNKFIVSEGFYSSCQECNRLYHIDPDTGQFSVRHKTRDNIPHLYCDSRPADLGVWIDANTNVNIETINITVNTPLIIK